MKKISLDTYTITAKIPPREIGYVNALVEGYEGIGVLRTIDAKEGIIEFWVVPFFETIYLTLIEKLKSEISLEIIEK